MGAAEIFVEGGGASSKIPPPPVKTKVNAPHLEKFSKKVYTW